MKLTITITTTVVLLTLTAFLIGANRDTRTVTVTAGTLSTQIVARASVEAADGIAHVTGSAGTLRELRVAPGDHVEADAVVALIEQGSERHAIRAPLAGTVIRTHASRGDTIAPGALLLELAQLDKLVVRIEVDAAEAQRLAVGNDVTLRPLGGGESLASGKLTRSAPTIAPRSIGSNDARIRAEGLVVAAWIDVKDTRNLVLGQELEAAIALPSLEVPALLPHTAIAIEDGHATVRQPGRLWPSHQRITLGQSDAEYVQVLDLPAGSTVLLNE